MNFDIVNVKYDKSIGGFITIAVNCPCSEEEPHKARASKYVHHFEQVISFNGQVATCLTCGGKVVIHGMGKYSFKEFVKEFNKQFGEFYNDEINKPVPKNKHESKGKKRKKKFKFTRRYENQ